MLSEGSHDALSALELSPRATDKKLLALATDKQPIIITEYGDIGDLAFVRRMADP